MKLKQTLITLAICALVPLQAGAEQVDAWSRADCVMPCEVVRLERTGLHYTADLLSYYDGIVRSTSVSLIDGRSLAVGDIIPCATGVDGNHTFMPQNGLARSEACAILNRAGYTTAAVKPKTGEGKTTDQIIAEIRATGLFDEKTETSGFGFTKTTLTVKDRKYGNLSISYYPTSDGSDTGIEIRASEYIKSLVYDKDGNILDENGNIFSKASEDCAYDKNGKYMPASGFSYTSRQLLKRVLDIALPTQGDEMYNAFMDMMTPPHTYALGYTSPSIVGWYDSRCVDAVLGGGIYRITLSTLNNIQAYESCMAASPTTKHNQYVYRVVGSTGFIDFEKAYELNKR